MRRRSLYLMGFLAALLGGTGQALTEQQKVAGDLLRIVGVTPAPCVEILPSREYAELANDDKAGNLVCGKYHTSISEAREACEVSAGSSSPIDWSSRRNFLQGSFERNGYRYTISMTCRDDEFIVKISKINP